MTQSVDCYLIYAIPWQEWELNSAREYSIESMNIVTVFSMPIENRRRENGINVLSWYFDHYQSSCLEIELSF